MCLVGQFARVLGRSVAVCVLPIAGWHASFRLGMSPLMSCLWRAYAQTRVPLLCILTSGVARGGTEAYGPDSQGVCVCVSVPVDLTLTLAARLSLAAAAIRLRPLPGCVHTGSRAEGISWDQWENMAF